MASPQAAAPADQRPQDDHRVKRWRLLDLGANRCVIEWELRRLRCRDCGVHLEAVPWARPGSHHTRDREDVVARLAQQMAKTSIAGLVRIGWDTVGRIPYRYSCRCSRRASSNVHYRRWHSSEDGADALDRNRSHLLGLRSESALVWTCGRCGRRFGSPVPPVRKRPEGRPAPVFGQYRALIDWWSWRIGTRRVQRLAAPGRHGGVRCSGWPTCFSSTRRR